MKNGTPVVIDTNVLLVANSAHPDVTPECEIACIQSLEHVRTHGIAVIDEGFEILREYERKTAPNTGNQVGDGFVKWIYQNAATPSLVERVPIEVHTERGFAEFPDDDELTEFDREDRKFVAVSLAHRKRPPILQATDSKWTEWASQLLVHGVKVKFLCPADVAKFIKRKRYRAA